MAIFHLSVKNGAPAHASAHATYIVREGAYAARDEDLRATESGNMPAWAAADPLVFWAAADLHERAKGRPYRELEVAIPRELNDVQRVELVREFVSNVLGERHAYTWAIHAPKASDQGEQPHAHIMFTERANDGIARDPYDFFRRWNAENPEQGGAGKDRYFNSKKFVWDIRSEWAELANEHLSRAGIEARIDPRSYRDQGLSLEPQVKRGAEYHGSDRQFLESITLENRERMRQNGERIFESPSLALDALTAHQSTFSRRDLQQFLLRNSDSPEQFEAVSLKVLHSPELVALRGQDGSERFTAKALFDAETMLVSQASELARREGQGVAATILAGVSEGRNFNAGQQAAFEKLTSSRALVAVNGAAGTGKSYVLTSMRQAYEQAGYRVVGAALQGRTAEDLEHEAGISSSTIHRLLAQLERGEVSFDRKTVLVIDEAGLVGSKQLGQLVDRITTSGASMRLVGDVYQLHSVAAGDAFNAVSHQLSEAGSAAALTEIQRQRVGWQREASQALSEHRIAEGIAAYRSRGFVTEHGTQAEARAGLLAQWWSDRRAVPDATQLLVTHNNRERQQLNLGARALRRDAGELGEDVVVQSVTGRLDLATGDRLVFTRNDNDLGVKNGSLGTIAFVSKGRVSVRLDGGQRVEIDPKQYGHFDHGYALTIHKSQGATVDRSYLLATSSMTARLAYVAMTRHRAELQVAYSREQFSGAQDFDWKLARIERKDFAADLVRRPFEPAQEPAKRETLAERRGLGAAAPVPPAAALGNTLTTEQIQRMSAAQLGAAIERMRPPEWRTYVEADQNIQAQAAVVRKHQEDRRRAEEASFRARVEIEAWRRGHSLQVGLHDRGIKRAGYLLERQALIAQSEKTVADLVEPLKKAVDQLHARAQELQKQYRVEHGPMLKRITKLQDVVKAKREVESVMKEVGDIARHRASGRAGYRDGDAYWKALPPAMQHLVKSHQHASLDRGVELPKDEIVKEAARWLQGQNRDRGMGR